MVISERLNLSNSSLFVKNNSSRIRPGAQNKHLVAVHGLGTNSDWLDGLVERATEDNLPATTFDLPGFGRSGVYGEIESYKQWTDALKQVWQGLPAPPSTGRFLLGHSLGGAICLNVIDQLDPSPAGIILVVPAIQPNPQAYPIFSFMLPTFAKAIMGFNNKIQYPLPAEVKEAVSDGRIEQNILTKELQPRVFLETFKLISANTFAFNKFKEIPLLMFLAGRDRNCLTPASQLFFGFCNSPDKTCKLYPQSAHDLFVLPEAVHMIDLISNWVKSH